MCARACAAAGGKVFDMHSDFMSYDDIQPQEMDHDLRTEHRHREWDWIHFIAREYAATLPASLILPSVLAAEGRGNALRAGCFFQSVAGVFPVGCTSVVRVVRR